MDYHKIMWSLILLAIVIVLLDFIGYRQFKKNIHKPFRRVLIKDPDLFWCYKGVDKLYRSYQRLPRSMLTLSKLHIKSIDLSNDFISQLLDLFVKLFLSVAVASITIMFTFSTAFLNYLNNDAMLKNDYTKWAVRVSDVLDNFIKGLDIFLLIFMSAVFLLVVASAHFFFASLKKTLVQTHITVIEEIEKENQK
ncbi:hypothetical protein NLX78_07835 [Paenibacillus sp. Lou8.1]|uniref:hypothetical protein n=1 Tax=Paenibacillus sp. Lou8.1 TaxID=2962041 RepID=UPI0020B86413|nr:hypothetical protein [Paenibacillus sp. Lou8.1]MCP3807142.1 hypothetical protein [Paenibacillus sp. Lou8.1]